MKPQMDSYMKPVYTVDHIIMGAGPAGIQLALKLEQAGKDYLVLEAKEGVASSFRKYPRSRKLISINKLYTDSDDNLERRLRWDWNCLITGDEKFHFRNYSKDYFPHADTLVRYLEDVTKHFKLKVRYNARVNKVMKDEMGKFVVTDAGGRQITSRQLTVATGIACELPKIKGIELATNYDKMSTDGDDYAGKRVLILGKKNSAFETADMIIPYAALIHICSPSSVDFAWRSHYIGDVRGLNVAFLDTYMLKIQNASLDAKVTGIRKKPDGGLAVSFLYGHAFGETQEADYDIVLACTGFNFNFKPFNYEGSNCMVKGACGKDEMKFPDIGYDFQTKDVDGLYVAGALTHRLDYKKKQSGFIHGFRYNACCLANILLERYHGTPYPTKLVLKGSETESRARANAILTEINNSSGIWQQSGFFVCVLVPSADGQFHGTLYPDMPKGYAHMRFKDTPLYYTCMLNFGQERLDRVGNVFNFERVHPLDLDNAHLSTGIHPIVGVGSYGKEVCIQHIIEDLESWWVQPKLHHVPMAKFLAINNAEVYKKMAMENPRKHTVAGLLLEDLPYEHTMKTEEEFVGIAAKEMPAMREMPAMMAMNKTKGEEKMKAKL